MYNESQFLGRLIRSPGSPRRREGSQVLEEETVCQSLSHARLFATPRTVACQAPLCPWDSPGKNTGVGCHFFLQGIVPTQESNPGLLHCRQILYSLNGGRGDRGLGFSRRRKGQRSFFFFLYIPQSQSHKTFFSFKTGTDDYTSV